MTLHMLPVDEPRFPATRHYLSAGSYIRWIPECTGEFQFLVPRGGLPRPRPPALHLSRQDVAVINEYASKVYAPYIELWQEGVYQPEEERWDTE